MLNIQSNLMLRSKFHLIYCIILINRPLRWIFFLMWTTSKSNLMIILPNKWIWKKLIFFTQTCTWRLLLWYVSQRAIFGAGMGRDDGYYCDVLTSGVNLFLAEGSSFYSIHWSFIVLDLLAASWHNYYIKYNVT